MVEETNIRSITFQHSWERTGKTSGPTARAQILVEDREIRDIITAQDDCTRRELKQRLDEIYAEHSKRGLLRSGATLLVGIAVFEEEVSNFIGSLAREASALTRSARVYTLIEEAVEQLLRLLDGELDCIARKVEQEIQGLGQTKELIHGVKILWAEKRADLLHILKKHRQEFAVPPEDARRSLLPTKTCVRCDRWEPMAEDPDCKAGFCRRFALAPQNDGWPITVASDYCEEWTGQGSQGDDGTVHVNL